jgi:glyoxylase-like metal-dependent hydrolase (beta-lactamase superfamily II)
MLKEIDKGIWVAEAPFKYFGLSVGTKMTVIRLNDGELAVISPITVDSVINRQLNELGIVSHIIAPNLYHYLFASDFKALYPKAIFWATSGLEVKKPELPIDRIISKDIDSFLGDLQCVIFDGFKTLGLNGFDSLNELVFFHPKSRTLIITDTAFHFDNSFPLITQFAARVIGGYKTLSPSLLEKVASTEKAKLKQSVQKILNWDFERVIMAHGSIIESQGKQKFKAGYESFLGQSIDNKA